MPSTQGIYEEAGRAWRRKRFVLAAAKGVAAGGSVKLREAKRDAANASRARRHRIQKVAQSTSELSQTTTAAGAISAMGPVSLTKEHIEDQAREAGLSAVNGELLNKSVADAADEHELLKNRDVARSSVGARRNTQLYEPGS